MAGTLVLTAAGLKKIEEIREGDLVLAYDEETGEQAYKPVTRLFRNTTEAWYHVRVDGEEIVCTGGHPFYILNADNSRNILEFEGVKSNGTGKWICARDLKISDQVLLSDGSCAIIEAIEVENLSAPETTYNFEVADYHTYYVSDSKVLVHNECPTPATEPKSFTKLKNGQGYKDRKGNIWKKDMKHKDHWDVSNNKGVKIKEVDYNGKQIWPNGPKNKNKR